MKALIRPAAAAALAAFLASGIAGAQDPPPAPKAPEAEKAAGTRSILWAKTWESALLEAKIRNVPIYILVSIGEG